VTELACIIERDGELILVRAPAPGIWQGGPWNGDLLGPDASVGFLSMLGRRSRLRLPPGAGGRVVDTGRHGSTQALAVSFGDVLVRLDPHATSSHERETASHSGASVAGLHMKSPSSGRFWRRPTPNDAPFVEDGQLVQKGDPIGLLEVMKTFTRLSYDGPNLPERARVVRVVPEDGDDVDAGSVLLELEPEAQ